MAITVNDDVPARLKRLRALMGHETQQAMADDLGVEFNRYNNMERGLPLSHEVAVRICQRVAGMTLDWLYFGKPDGLPFELAKRIGEAPTGAVTPSKRTKSARRA